MQIFTLGKMRIPLFFFALLLFSGTLSSYGQEECPELSDSNPADFCYLDDITDLSERTGATNDVVWYRDSALTQRIPSNEFLEDDTTYYAGNADGNCLSPTPVTVTVGTIPAPDSSYGSVFSPYLASENDDRTIEDLIEIISPNAGGEIIVYQTEFGTATYAESDELVDGNSYFVGQTSSTSSCDYSFRLAIRYSPDVAPAPIAEDQELCQGATVSDLQATGTSEDTQAFRWYSTATSNPALADNELLVPGTYYVSQIVNDEGNPSPPVESQARTAVNVTLTTGDAGSPNTGVVCETDVQETFPSIDAINNYLLGLLSDGVSGNGTFNPTPAQLAQQYQNDEDGLGDFTTTYTLGEDECEASVQLTISVVATEEANAGQDVTLEFAIDDETQDLYSFLTSEAQTSGTFEGYPDGLFDPSQTGAGVYTVTYTVDETNGCITGTDSAIFTITVAPCEANAGEDVNETFCRTEIEALVQQIINAQDPESQDPDPTAGMEVLAEWLGDRDLDGTFEGDFSGLERFLFPGIPLTEPVTVIGTYIVGEGECEDTAAISITVIEDANAGNDNTITLSPDDAPVDLFTLLGEDAQEGGTWSSGNGTFNPATDAAGTYTYTVGTGGCTDSASVVVTLTTDPTDPGVGFGVVCLADVQTIFPSIDAIKNYYFSLLPAEVTSANGSFNPTPAQMAAKYQADEDGLGEFTSVYTVNGKSYELTINVVTEAEAGDDVTVALTTEDDVVNLFEYLGENAQQGGTWSKGNGFFDPSTDESGSFTYTIGYEGCMDSAVVTVVVTDTPDPSNPSVSSGIVCLADVQTIFPSIDAIKNYYFSLLPAEVTSANGSFNPTPAQMAAKYQADEDGLGEFTSVYTVNGKSYELTINVVAEAFAGDDATVTLTTEDDEVTLFEYLGENAQQGGTWSNGDGTFDPATDEPGTFTYTVGYEGCMDSATVTVTVSTDPCTGIVDAGTDSSADVCETDVQTTFPSIDEIRKFYFELLDAGVSREGTFSPTPAEISAMYQADEDGFGDFTTTYTLTNGECTDSVELTVTIVPTEPASTGDISDITTCTAEGTLNLFDFLNNDNTLGGTFSDASGVITDGMLDVSEEGAFTITYTVEEGDTESCIEGSASTTFTVNVTANTANAGADNSVEVCNSEVENLSNAGVRNLYISLLESGVATNGSFNPSIQEIIDDYNINSKFGDFTTTYTVGTGQCTDSAVLTVTVLENPNAGENATVNLEEDATETVDLFAELGGSPETGGTWTFEGDEVDATFDPATDAEGVYTYTVTSDNGCSDSATVTVIVGTEEPECNEENTPAAPTVTPFDGCAASATVADLVISGEDGAVFSVYAEETLDTELDATQGLTAGTYYVTQTNTTGCVSDATAVTVTLNDVDAPALLTEPEQLCAGQQLTVANLEGSVIANGDLVWYTTATGSETVSPSTPLQNGTTLFAAAVDATSGCESSTRTRVDVTLENCEVVIPEIFSPNGDSINDKFVIENISSEYPNHMMEIYNRWGEAVYKGQVGRSQGWDGTSSEGSFGNGVLPVGVYFYILNYNDGQTAPIQGRVYLSR
ncbi:gliding motility-associated C-terminal domain-containing protein [Salinimicrobium tongyeongense]|uniref:Gliding motility-associated C-terminal domain-containing protein n=1 Tax=Salinimicrobium tongyeongense TaxID=2809707 RepID=A0ABY6NN78_9FLAO|nr:gliding motility-associated C-terminal domain-containing protein [Salinimicrobium tongyeongense]UZH54308.1 gliding motility-associated C-terminal domain-containing protein [Salinimicrobium tongyeongense]